MTTVVRATAYGGPEVLSLDEVPTPVPAPDQVLVSVRAAGVNQADVKVYAGIWGTDPDALPMPLGFEVSGVVTAVGADVTGVAVGDEVIAHPVKGGYASEVLAPAGSLTAKPAGLGWAEASGLMLTGKAAAHAVTAAGVSEGDTVLVHGAAGGVGLIAVQLATLRGARVIGTAAPEQHALLAELGAVGVSYGDGLLERVTDLAPEGVDAALDLAGTDEALDVSLALVGDRARIATIANFDRGPQEGIRVLGVGGEPGTEIRAAAGPELARLAADGELRLFVEATFPLTEVVAAHELLASRRATGKIVLLP
ncbi:quinone oxidoreductase family protein [Marmoricola sp. RAF53]|uniref:quinone oxidoreductase family protein n=1 Tax=Marmoricola sp. RAF53 TaxID=3233059 RepID=UPI003F9E4BBA